MKETEHELTENGNFSHYCGTHLCQQFFMLSEILQSDEFNDSPKLRMRYIHNQISLIIMHLVKEVTSVHFRKTSIHVKNARRFIDQNIHKNISVNDVATAAGISVGYLHEIFKNEEGLSPADFIQRTRCEKSKDLLNKGLSGLMLVRSGSTSRVHQTLRYW